MPIKNQTTRIFSSGLSMAGRGYELPSVPMTNIDEYGKCPAPFSGEPAIKRGDDWLSITDIGNQLAENKDLLTLFITYFPEQVAVWCKGYFEHHKGNHRPYYETLCIHMVNELAKEGYCVKNIYGIVRSRYMALEADV